MPTFSNQAQLSYNGITANSNIAYGQILEVLAASKTALSDTYASGDRITYIFSIVNSGTTAFSDLGRVKLLWSFFVDKLQCFLTVQYVSAFS